MLPEDYEVVKDQLAPCGLRCGECDLGNGSVAETALNLKEYIQRYDLPVGSMNCQAVMTSTSVGSIRISSGSVGR